MLRLAAPLAVGELGWMAMSIVDTIMVGRLPESAVAIGATALGSGIFYTFAICGGGLLLGLDTLVAQAYGRGDLDDCNHSLLQSLYLAAALLPVIMLCNFAGPFFLARFGISAELVTKTQLFLNALNWSAAPLLLYFALRRYLQALHHVAIVMFALVTANLFNFLFNWLFIFPHQWGSMHFGGMGVAGSGWSTCWARMYMAGLLVAAVVYYNHRDRLGLGHAALRIDPGRIRKLLELGAPAATQIFFEIAVFSFTGVLAGKLGALPLAAHQIALNCAALSYMVPLGISSAAAVRTGHAWGRKQPQQAHRAGHAAILLGCGFMAVSAVLFLMVPRTFARIFSPDSAVVVAGAKLLLIAAAFQLFDGLQIVMTGALRGIGNTRLPMLANFIGYWTLGLPLGALLCFRFKLGVFGLWIGLCVGLISIALILFAAWERRFQKVGSKKYELVSSHES
jgi:MATE family multidrug resistance protein